MIMMVACEHVASSGTKDDKTETFRNKGIAYMQAQQYPEALEYFINGMESARDTHNDYAYISCLGNIGSVYGAMGNYERSLYYQNLAYMKAIEANDTAMQSELLVNLVGSSCAAGKVEDAKKYLSLQKTRPMPDKKLADFYYLYNSAVVARLQNLYDKAAEYYTKGAEMALNTGDSVRAISQYLGKAECLLQLGDTVTAEMLTRRAVNMADDIGNMGKQRDAYTAMTQLFSAPAQKDSVDKYAEMASSIGDSLFNRGREMLATNKHLQFENKITTDVISGLNNTIKTQTLFLIFIISVTVILITATILIYRNMCKLRTSQRLIVNQNRQLIALEEQARKLLSEATNSDASQNQEEDVISADSDDKSNSEVTLSPNKVRDILSKVMDAIGNPKVLYDPSFSLNTLADIVGVNSKYVSYVIKESSGKNFKAFINERRIREVCRRLDDPKYANLTIQAIYREVGFKSPATFNDAFKKMTGMTPSAYQKRAAES